MKPEFIPPAPFCIYGAGIVAASIYTEIKTLYDRIPLGKKDSRIIVIHKPNEGLVRARKTGLNRI